jgi:DNA-binding MarR family transcriptional regulator
MAMPVRPVPAARPAIRSGAEKAAVVGLIRSISQELRTAGRAVDGDLGITAAQVDVLRAIRSGSPCSINEIAERTFTHQSTVSSIVARLAEDGLVSRGPSPDDGRRQAIALTAAGKRRLRQAPESSEQRLLAALRSMSRDELKTLARFLGRLSSELAARAGY